MIAQIKGIKITPTKYDDDSVIDKDRFATVTVEIPMDCKENIDGVAALLDTCDSEFVEVDLEAYQRKIPGLGGEAGKEATAI